MDNEDIFEPDDNYTPSKELHAGSETTKLSGMYKEWFLDYASYVILERAVPHINDGLKPVQRRLLHAMYKLEDGRFNKVANIIGHTMQYHPHGDASIGGALVQLGQKNLLVETQGNWGNIHTGDSAAAPRYIEARLSKFALEVVFNPKTTNWKLSYDGRNNEPVTLPAKFPLLLALGGEGIAVGLSSKILPHNFNEIIDASIKYLRNERFSIYPDFPAGGQIDVSRYNDGHRGGAVKVRAKINKVDNKTLSITELPFGVTTSTLIESIIRANEKGKIKIKKIDDNTAENVDIIIHLAPNISPDITIDALYAFSDCEVSISPNCCVIENNKPRFESVSTILINSTENTVALLKKELQIRLEELEHEWHKISLEKIFFLKEIHQTLKNCKTEEEIYDTIHEGLKPYTKKLRQKITRDDLVRLSNAPVKRISKYSHSEADKRINHLEAEMDETNNHLNNIIDYSINYFKQIKKTYGKGQERKTEIRSFDTIVATSVAVANEKLFVNKKEGFVGTSLKKDEYVCDCSDIDDLLVILENGKYLITKVSEKAFIGKDILHVSVFKKDDTRTVFNIIYRDGLSGPLMVKRCNITGLMRDKEYDITKGASSSKILYLTSNPNGESEVVTIRLKPRQRIKNLKFDFDFGSLAVKGRNTIGNILSRYPIHKISHKEKGVSTLGGTKIWFDEAVQRLNYDERGMFLGEFHGNDKITVITKSGMYRLCSYDVSNHFEDDLLSLEKYKPDIIYTAVYFNGENKKYHLKRFQLELSEKPSVFIGDNPNSKLLSLSKNPSPKFVITIADKGGKIKKETINSSDYSVMNWKAKGKKISDTTIKSIEEIEVPQVAQTEQKQTERKVEEEKPAKQEPPKTTSSGKTEQMKMQFDD